MRTIDLYKTDIKRLVKNKTKEEVLELLIEATNRDMEIFFWVSLENIDCFEDVGVVNDWINSYWDNLNYNISTSVKKFLDDNQIDLNELMRDCYKVFTKLINQAKEIFS